MKKEKKNQEKPQQPDFFKELGSFMKPYKGKYAASVIISILSVASGIGAYAFAGMIADNIFSDSPGWKTVLVFLILAAAAKILSTLLLNFSTWISHKAAYGTLRDIRLAVSEKMLRLPMGYFEEKGTGRLKTLLVDNIENMEKTLAHMLPELTADFLCPAVLFIWMFVINWKMALAALIWIMLGFSVTSGMMKGYDEKFAGQIAAHKNMNQAVNEYVNGIEVIKNFGRADECYKKYQDAVYGHAEYNVNWQKETQRYSALGMAIAPFSVFPVLITGLILYNKGSVEAGTVFMMVILTLGIFAPLMNSSNYFDQLAGMGTNAKEIKDVLEYPELKRGDGDKTLGNDIIFDNVSFTYEGSTKKALDGVSFSVPEGTMFALVGPSGSGKSTAAKLIAGYRDKDEGEILIGGQRIESLSQEKINSLISFVDQDTFLFDMSIADNIRLAKPGASDEEVKAAAKKAGCDEFIKALPEGYNTMAGTAGCRLSGGEKQRISIARAMMKNAPVMILDEATASNDPENEASVQEAVSAAAEGKTLIVIAHRLKTITEADNIAYFENGRISCSGTHEELLKKCSGYRDMWMKSEVSRDD